MMPVPLGSQGQADFSQPIELMMDCHRRIEHFLEVLGRVISRYADRLLDNEGRHALETALNYFDQAAPRHTADEEQSLFPRMRASDDAAVRDAFKELDRLEADHRHAEVTHARLDALGRQWLADGQLPLGSADTFCTLLTMLGNTYEDHIRLEDEQVFTLASRVLDSEALTQVGDEMKQRRQDHPGRPGSRCAARRQGLPSAELQ